MPAWSRDPLTSRLTRTSSPPELKPDSLMAQPPSLQDRFYPLRTSIPSCIKLSNEGVDPFELKPQYISTLPKFHGLESEDAYFFIREFEEVCLMINMPKLGKDAIKLRFVPFALKDLAKKWLYSLEVGSIDTWDSFVKAFLKKFYPVHKTALIRKNILQFKQTANEPFWKYFERFKDLLAQCPHHGVEKWRLCQVIYDGLDYSTKTLLESMCQGGFLEKNENEGWSLFEDLAEKAIQWDPTPEKSRTNDPTSSKGGIHSIEANIANDAKLAAVMRRLEALETKEPVSVNQVSPTSLAGCTYCQDRNHVFEECPVFIAHQSLPEHTSAAFTRPANNPYSSTYNPG